MWKFSRLFIYIYVSWLIVRVVTLYCSITFKKAGAQFCSQSYLALPYDLRKIESDSDYANGLMYNIKMITTPLVSFERKFLGLALAQFFSKLYHYYSRNFCISLLLSSSSSSFSNYFSLKLFIITDAPQPATYTGHLFLHSLVMPYKC